MTKRKRTLTKWHQVNAHRRLLLALFVACAATLLLPAHVALAMRLAASWDLGVIVFLVMTWRVVQTAVPGKMQQTVREQDQGRVGILVLVLLAVTASLSAIFLILQRAKGLETAAAALHVGLAVLTIVCSWIFTHVMFALHYAHRFYRDDPDTAEGDATGGLRFPDNKPPHYWDFIYFSFVIGMTSQVSDVQVTSRPMRLLVFWHSLLSFAFYTVVLALTIGIVASLI